MAEVIRKSEKKTPKTNNVRLSEGVRLCGDIEEINRTESDEEQECAEWMYCMVSPFQRVISGFFKPERAHTEPISVPAEQPT